MPTSPSQGDVELSLTLEDNKAEMICTLRRHLTSSPRGTEDVVPPTWTISQHDGDAILSIYRPKEAAWLEMLLDDDVSGAPLRFRLVCFTGTPL